MKSLERFIVDNEDVADVYMADAEYCSDPERKAMYINAAEKHRQLAAWLRELQDRRCEPEVTFCRSCNWNDGTCYCNFHYRNVKPYNYCSWAERRSE